MQTIYNNLIKDLHTRAKAAGVEKAVLGLSGGLDSTVALCLAVRAFGARNVMVLSLPESGLTPHEDLGHARLIADHFGCKLHQQSLNNFVSEYQFISWDKPETAQVHAKARTRATLLRHFAEANDAWLLGAANKSDLLLGLGHPDGEFEADLHLLGDLLKTEVQRLATFIGLPEELIQKTPSRQLSKGQTDESDLGAPWMIIDEILRDLSEGKDPDELIQRGREPLLVHRIVRMLHGADPRLKHLPTLLKEPPEASIKRAQQEEASSLFME